MITSLSPQPTPATPAPITPMITPQEIKDANAAQAAEYRKTAAFWSAEFEATADPEDAEKAAYYAARAAQCAEWANI